jgi:hypothetical protein
MSLRPALSRDMTKYHIYVIITVCLMSLSGESKGASTPKLQAVKLIGLQVPKMTS